MKLILRNPLQFGIKHILAATTLLALALSYAATKVASLKGDWAREQSALSTLCRDASVDKLAIRNATPFWLSWALRSDIGERVTAIQILGATPRADFSVMQGLSELEQLTVREGITEAQSAQVGRLARIRELQYIDTVADDSVVSRLGSLTRLTDLNVDCPNVTDNGLKFIERIEDLQSLRIRCDEITDRTLVLISKQRHLTTLSICRRGNFLGGDLSSLRALTSLSDLTISADSISVEDLDNIAAIKSLRTLGFTEPGDSARCVEVSAEGLAKLSELPALTTIVLPCSSVSEIAAAGAMPHLEELDLAGGEINEACVQLIAKFPVLRKLRLIHCSFATPESELLARSLKIMLQIQR